MNSKLFAIISIFVLSSLIFYLVNEKQDYQSLKPQLKVSYLMHNPDKPLPEFSLVDHNNQIFNNTRLKGKWSLLLFIYTHCPDICPTELLDLSRLKNLMKNNMPNVVAITFDPLRDTPEVLKQYVTYFDKNFIGVSGDETQINQLIKHFGAYYERVIRKNNKPITVKAGEKLPKNAIKDGYTINHTAWIYLISPKGQIVSGFPSPHKPKAMAKDIQLTIDKF